MTIVLAAGHWAERTDGRKNLFKREKNLPVVILSFREQTLTNIIHDNHGKQPNLRFHVPSSGRGATCSSGCPCVDQLELQIHLRQMSALSSALSESLAHFNT